MRLWLVALILLCLGAGNKRIVVVRGQQFPSTIAIVVDNSGSMDGKPYQTAVGYAMWVAEQAGDEARVRFAVFGDDLTWQDGDWIKLPDKEALEASKKWLIAQGTGGATHMADAIAQVLKLTASPLGVIIVTDENPSEEIEATCAKITLANKSRKEPAVIGVIGVYPDAIDKERLGVFLATETGGTYLKIVEKENKP